MRTIRFIVLLSILFLVLSGCEKDKVTLDEKGLIVAKTDGILDPVGPVVVIFTSPQVEETGEIKNPFDFKPSFPAKAMWKDKRTLVLIPESDLSIGEEYQGYLDMSKIASIDGKIPISFTVSGRMVRDMQYMFSPVERDNPNSLKLEADLSLNSRVSEDKLKDGLNIYLGKGSSKKELEYRLSQQGNVNKIEVIGIDRKDYAQDFLFELDKDKLGLEQPWSKIVTLPKKGDFRVFEVKKSVSESQVILSLVFSDQVPDVEGLERFIQISPDVDFDLRTSANKIILMGNFAFGEKYDISVLPGIRNIWGIALSDTFRQSMELPQLDPKIKFSSTGSLLPTSTGRKIAFQTANVRRVHINVKKVFANNLIYFLQDYNMPSGTTSNQDFWSLYKVGEVVLEDTLDIGSDRNVWLQSELDLSKLIPASEKGVFIIELSANEEDILAEDVAQSEDYWGFWSYRRENLYVVKPLIVSDLGIIAKREKESYRVFVTDIKTGSPISGIEVKVYSYHNQVLARGKSEMDGSIKLECNENAFAITAERAGERSVVLLNDDRYNTSVFNTGGVSLSDEGLKAYTYTDRGIYRPGDSIHVTSIIRNEMNTFPDNHPVEIEWYNPRGSLIEKRVLREAEDGFYVYHLRTRDNSPTGNWMLSMRIGESTFHRTIRVETIVPYRLKVEIDAPETIKAGQSTELTLKSRYLFGAPAALLAYKMDVTLIPIIKEFKGYEGFIFFNPSIDFERDNLGEFDGNLTNLGTKTHRIEIPNIQSAPSDAAIMIEAEVSEPSGRAVPKTEKIEIGIYDQYVGINVDGFTYRRVGAPAVFNAITLDMDGKPLTGRRLYYNIYHRSKIRWYDFDRDNWKLHFKQDESTVLVEKGSIVSSMGVTPVSFVPEEYGEYFVEIGIEGAHSAGYFFRAGYWGQDGGSEVNMISLTTDRETYTPGQKAIISGKLPENSKILLSVEKGMEVLYTKWIEGSDISIPITENMAPNAYAVITAIEPYNDLKEGQPLRLYGIVPIMVENENTRLPITIKMPEKLSPKQDFDVEIETKAGAQVTLAIVDEGILDITGFKSPSPWDYFYGKEALSVWTSDLFGRVIGPIFGDIHKVFSIGGDMEMMLDQGGTRPKTKRFKPVALFRGPVKVNMSGKAKLRFTMPNYMGSVRAMAVAAEGEAYGMAEKTVPVSAPIVLLPTLPRVLGPMDKVEIPVTVFATEKGIGNVNLSLSVQGMGKAVGDRQKTVNLSDIGDTTIYFDIEADNPIGEMKVKIEAKSGLKSTEQEISLAVRASGVPTTTGQTFVVDSGQEIEIPIPNDGVKGTNQAWISLYGLKPVEMGSRIKWLLNYPYGCIEQTVSSVFPQLYLKDIAELTPQQSKETDQNLNAAIARMSRFQLQTGGFTYWPDGGSISDWGSIYAGHFMVEAKEKGYSIPEHLFNGWLRYEKRQSRAATGNLLTRCYRLYVLALADESDIGSMNVIRENALDELSETAKWYLAAAYALSDRQRIAGRIAEGADTKPYSNYTAFDPTFGSHLRDKAIVLEMLTVLGRDKEAMEIYNEIAEGISDGWHSTQTTAYSLLALGKFMEKSARDREMKGYVETPERKLRFNTKKVMWQRQIEGFGGVAKVKNEGTDPVFVELAWSGVPMRGGVPTSSSKLNLNVAWVSEDGRQISIGDIEQGTEFYAFFGVKNASTSNIENISLAQLLPAGWEIENPRLREDNSGMFDELSSYDYLDIRDDGAYWFFDLRAGEERIFGIKLRAVTPGTYHLPATYLSAMYDNTYRATIAGRDVRVRRKP